MTTVPARTAGDPAMGRSPFASVALVSCAALAYELLLLRLSSIIQWHHFYAQVPGLVQGALDGHATEVGGGLALQPAEH
ncbi:MAG: hypothetical protein COA89_13335 [Acidithiobacillus sp.]|nr:MAG: hypothetical protein COA89_13335 [Acidithiobacillus sp.]